MRNNNKRTSFLYNPENLKQNMICFIALVVFGILGIFSASYRQIAADAFDCVFRRVTFRKCTTGLDKKLKSHITGKLMRKNKALASFTYKNFETLSWIFTILLIASFAYSAYGVYNLAAYGNCNGPEPNGFCIFNPDATGSGGYSSIDTVNDRKLTPPMPGDDPSIGPEDAPVTIIEFGCFQCSYTRNAVPIVEQILREYKGKIRFVYKDFPLHIHHESQLPAYAAQCVYEQGSNLYWKYYKILFENQDSITNENLKLYANLIGVNTAQFNECLEKEKYREEVDNDYDEGIASGIYGTPTFFINDVAVVGPKPFKVFKKIIDKELGN